MCFVFLVVTGFFLGFVLVVSIYYLYVLKVKGGAGSLPEIVFSRTYGFLWFSLPIALLLVLMILGWVDSVAGCEDIIDGCDKGPSMSSRCNGSSSSSCSSDRFNGGSKPHRANASYSPSPEINRPQESLRETVGIETCRDSADGSCVGVLKK